MNAPDAVIALDAADRLAHKRSEFSLPDNTIYLDGNSLGPLPKCVKPAIDELVTDQWGADLIHSWNRHQWIDLPSLVGEKIAPLIGAAPNQVIACDSISVNLFKLLAAALKLNTSRSIVLSQTDNFPTDLYIAQGLSDLLGEQHCQLKQVAGSDLIANLDESVAVLLLTEVNFRTGELHDMRVITELAHSKGVLVIWDLAHSAGALPIELDQCQVDFAVGCGYKYFNGGPGAPAFVYVSQRHQPSLQQPLSGWMGHKAPFNFEPNYRQGKGITRLLSGTPNILSMVALDAALTVFDQLNMHHVRLKDLNLLSPSDPQRRGSHLAYSHDDGFAITQALIEHGVVVDFRAPNIIRFGLTPLTLSYQDIWQATQILTLIMREKLYCQPKYQRRQKVT